MFFSAFNTFLSVITCVIISQTCNCELPPPASLYLYSPGDLEYTEVMVRRAGDNLTLVCELRGDGGHRDYVWNFMPGMPGGNSSIGASPHPLVGRPAPDAPHRSQVAILNVSSEHTGRYMCSSPPFSQTKFILVQTAVPKHCARSAFSCGQRCVLPAYVCDGRPDCERREDEDPQMCRDPCSGPDKLNCSSGRCIPLAACCGPAALCRQPACCDEHGRGQASFDEFPLPPEDRHAPDDYGFIQSTIYTVTACALIFMIAVVLLVSAICKMHMKRAALRSYAAAERATRRHYSAQYAQSHRFPPCYEASRLLDADRGDALDSPARLAGQCAVEAPNSPEAGFGLGRLSEIFSSRYRQVPTQCCEVEMQNVRPASATASPARSPERPYDLGEFYFSNAEAGQCGRELNSMATPVEFFRRRALRRNTLERVMDSLGERPRPFTLQLGRFQLSIPKFGRRASTERRPDTPNVAEIDIEDLDFVRLNSNDTYTLNGRTIRLLGANFENYPVMADGSIRPPPYTEAMRYKLYGPPPEYLSRDGLNGQGNVDEEARNNIEMPPNYDELGEGASTSAGCGPSQSGVGPSEETSGSYPSVSGSGCGPSQSGSGASGVSNGPSQSSVGPSEGTSGSYPSVSESGCGPSQSGYGPSGVGSGYSRDDSSPSQLGSGPSLIATEGPSVSGTGISNSIVASTSNNNISNVTSNDNATNTCSSDNNNASVANNNTYSAAPVPSNSNGNLNNNVIESIKSVIDNLPAIDSDVNANEAEA